MSDMVAKAAQLLETDVSVHQTETEADWEPDKKRNKKQKKQAYMDEATVYKGHVKTARSSVTGMPTTKKSRIHINPLAQRIQHLRDCQVAGLITCEEFEKTKSAILKSFVEDQAKFVRTLTGQSLNKYTFNAFYVVLVKNENQIINLEYIVTQFSVKC